MTPLVESLKEQGFQVETIEPYGLCLLIPNKEFKPEWTKQLENEKCRIYFNSYNGEVHAFVKLPTVKEPNSKFRKRWMDTEVKQLKEFVSVGLKPSEIASKLGRTATAVKGKIQRLNLNSHVQPTSKLELNPSIGDDVVKEYLACVSEIYPKFPNACAFLLKEASDKILGSQQNV